LSSGGHGTHGGGGKDAPVEIPHGGGNAHAEEGEAWLVSYADLMTLFVGFFVIMLSFAKVDDEKFEEVRKVMTQKFGGVYEIPYGDLSTKIKDAVEKLGQGNQIIVKQNEGGVEISFFGTVFFQLGSVDIRSEAQTLLNTIVPIIREDTTEFDITVEGHTDDIPISSSFMYKNNWELSSIRACRVLDYFRDGKFKKDRLTAVGYGEARPLKPNRDPQGNAIPENQSQNRRVVIKLTKHAAPVLGTPHSETETANAADNAPSSNAKAEGTATAHEENSHSKSELETESSSSSTSPSHHE